MNRPLRASLFMLAWLLSQLAPAAEPVSSTVTNAKVLLDGKPLADREVRLGDRIDIVFDAPDRSRVVGCPEGKGPLTLALDGVPATGVESLTPPESGRAAFVVRRTDESADLWLDLFKRSKAGGAALTVSIGLACKKGGPFAVTAAASAPATKAVLEAAASAASSAAAKAASAAAAASSVASTVALEAASAASAAASAVAAVATLAATAPASAASATTTVYQSPSTVLPEVQLRMLTNLGWWWLAMLVLLALTLGVLNRGILRDTPPSPSVLAKIAGALAPPVLPPVIVAPPQVVAGPPLIPPGVIAPADMPFSLSKTQLLLWTLAVIAVASYTGIVTGQLPALNAQVLSFIGVSAGTSILAQAIEAQRSKMPTKTIGFFSDIVNDESNQPSIARFQVIIVTIVLLAYFLRQGFASLLLPPLDVTWVALMGLSSATYLSFKLPDVKGPTP